MWAMPMYSILPAVTEWVVEQGWTRSYTRIGEVGSLKYLTLFAVYMCCVEYFVYWSHRSLHDIRLGYRCVWLSLQSVEDMWPVLLLEKFVDLHPFIGCCGLQPPVCRLMQVCMAPPAVCVGVGLWAPTVAYAMSVWSMCRRALRPPLGYECHRDAGAPWTPSHTHTICPASLAAGSQQVGCRAPDGLEPTLAR